MSIIDLEFYCSDNVNDHYGVKKEWKDCLVLSEKITNELDEFFSRKTGRNRSSVRARKMLKEMRKIIRLMEKDILRTRQDWKAEY